MHVSDKTIVQWMNYLRDDTMCARPRKKLQKRFIHFKDININIILTKILNFSY